VFFFFFFFKKSKSFFKLKKKFKINKHKINSYQILILEKHGH